MPIAVNDETGDVLIWNGQAWSPISGTGQGPWYEGGTMGGPGLAGIATTAQRLGRAGARMVNALLPGQPVAEPQPDPALERAYPVATAAGKAAPYLLTPVPGGPLVQAAAGGLTGALFEDDPAKGAMIGAGSSLATAAGMTMAQRVARGIRTAGSGVRRTLPSGIEQTTGEAVGSDVLKASEQSLARFPFAGRPFAARSARNRALVGQRVLKLLGQEGDELTEAAIGQAWRDSIDNIAGAVPDQALVPVPDDVQAVVKRFNALPDELVDIPEGAVLTGKQFRNARSDILKLTKSPKATVRDKARAALEALDDAAEVSGTIDPERYRLGRRQYRMWKTVTAPGVTKPGPGAGTLDINPAALDRSIQRQFGAQTTQGGLSTGFEEVDALKAAVRDLRRTRDFTQGSITTTGMGLPAAAADVVATGGLGTLGMMGLAELTQAAPMTGFLAGAAEPASAGLAPAAGLLGRLLGERLAE